MTSIYLAHRYLHSAYLVGVSRSSTINSNRWVNCLDFLKIYECNSLSKKSRGQFDLLHPSNGGPSMNYDPVLSDLITLKELFQQIFRWMISKLIRQLQLPHLNAIIVEAGSINNNHLIIWIIDS